MPRSAACATSSHDQTGPGPDGTEMWLLWRAIAEYLHFEARDRALQKHWHRAITEQPPERGSLLPSRAIR